jgi:hypothetical protein
MIRLGPAFCANLVTRPDKVWGDLVLQELGILNDCILLEKSAHHTEFFERSLLDLSRTLLHSYADRRSSALEATAKGESNLGSSDCF